MVHPEGIRQRLMPACLAAAMLICCRAPARAELVRILHSDQDAFQARVDLVQQARHEINASYYIVGDDDLPLVFLALLRDAARRGVTVRLIVDAHDANNLMPRALQAQLLREKVQIKEFHPPVGRNLNWLTHRMHDKLLIVDGEHLIMGGRNIKNEFFGRDCRNYVDRDVYLRGAVAAEARCYFMARWTGDDVLPTRLGGKQNKHVPEHQKHPELNDACDAEALGRASALLDEAPHSMEKGDFVRFNTARDWSAGAREVSCIRFLHDIPDVKKRAAGIGPDMLELLSTAQSSLVLETPYMAISRQMRRVLAALRRRGVSVTILTNSFETNDHQSAQAIYENRKRWMLRRGIELWELRGCDHLHAKAAIIDGCIAVIGSYNFDQLSQKKNSEVAVAIYDAEVAASLLESFNLHLQRAYPIGRNARPIGYNRRYPGADRQERRELRFKRIVEPFVKRFL